MSQINQGDPIDVANTFHLDLTGSLDRVGAMIGFGDFSAVELELALLTDDEVSTLISRMHLLEHFIETRASYPAQD